MMTPTPIEIGGLALITGMFALAQRLGGWEHRLLARCLAILAAGLFGAWCFLFFPIWVGSVSAAIVWSICLWFIFAWVRKPTVRSKAEETDEDRKAREHLYEFFRICVRDLYRDSTDFANSVQTKLGNGEDLRGCLAGIHRVYTERDFCAQFTKLTALIPPHPEASGTEPLRSLELAFWHFIQSYDYWAHWTKRIALLVPIGIHIDRSYLQWNKSDTEFLRRLNETTATAGLYWLNQQTSGLVQNGFRRLGNLER